MTTEAIEFIGDEAGYLSWLDAHPNGYVLNLEKSKNPNNMVLHGAWCELISDYEKSGNPGGFTGPSYTKVCAPDVEGLRKWVREHGRPGGKFKEGCYCLQE